MKIFGIFFAIFLVFAGAYIVFAQEEPNIQFPVAELGNCGSKEECKAYCDEVDHMAQCIDFAERNGLMRGEELEEAKKVRRVLEQGAQLPGGCTSKESCEAYCEDGSHIEECLAFAETAGFMSPEELEEARRIAPLMARGEMPGGCRSREQCEAYCSQENNTQECADFFVKAGFITPEEAEMFRKTGGRGPGGCQGRAECEAFCNDPANQKECFAFAKEHDLIPEEELQNIEEGVNRFREGFGPEGERRMPPPESMGCVERILGERDPFAGPPSPELEQRIREECFSQPEGFRDQPSPEDFERFAPPPDGEIPEEFRGEFDQQFQEEPPPETRNPHQRFLGAVWEAMKAGLARLITG